MFFYNRCVEKKKLARLLEISENNDGYVSMDDLKMHSIERTYLSLAVEEGVFTRVGKGLYLRKGYEKDPYYLTHHTYKKAVIALKSAAILWGLLPERGDPLMLYLPTGYMTKGIEGAKCRHVGNKEYGIGQALLVTEKDNLVPSYDLERTLLDIIRHPNLYEKAELSEALKKGFAKRPDEEKLNSYAMAFHSEEALALAKALYA